GLSPSELAAPADSVSVCFSKALGAPVGSALCGSAPLVADARRFRRMLGGGMRQAGILAAAALYALDHHRERIAQDPPAARAIAAELATVAGAVVHPVETNLLYVDTPNALAEDVVSAAARRGVLIAGAGRRIRVATHLDLRPNAVAGVARALCDAVVEALAGT